MLVYVRLIVLYVLICVLYFLFIKISCSFMFVICSFFRIFATDLIKNDMSFTCKRTSLEGQSYEKMIR